MAYKFTEFLRMLCSKLLGTAHVFAQAISKASVKGRSQVAVTNVNMAASDLVGDKLRFVEMDSSGTSAEVNGVLDRVRNFCIKQQKKNAFLVEVQNDDPTFERIRELIDLRLLHVIHEGIVKREAGRKHTALILDYGFYIGMRAAKSIDLFNRRMGVPPYNQLRALPVFPLSTAVQASIQA